MLDRGLVPCLSAGTLQLSIRCSSIHFLPSRSFPVSGLIVFGAVMVSPPAGVWSWARPFAAPTIANSKARAELSSGFTVALFLDVWCDARPSASADIL